MADDQHTTLGELFKNRREPGQADMPLMSVTMNDGLVDRESMVRKTDSELTSEGHLLVRAGDIAYNMMRMWQGASGLAKHDAIVSPAYVVLAPTADIDPLFASYWFKSARMVYMFWAYSYGITGDRLRLYYKDFARIPVVLPPKPRQTLIGNVLSVWDREIEGLQRLIVAKQQLKHGLAQQLLTGHRKIRGFNGSWQPHKLGHIAQLIFSNVDKKSIPNERSVRLCNYTDVYYHDVITPDMPFMQATATDAEVATFGLKKHDVVITKDSETPDDIAKPAVVAEDLPGVICGYHLAIVRCKQSAYGPFLAHLFRLARVRHEFMRISNGVTRYGLGQRSLGKLTLELPSTVEQRQIADVLGNADREIFLLERKVTLLIKQKRGLMQQLFDEGTKVTR